MYSLLKAVGKSVTNNGRWEQLDISNMLFSEIYTKYALVYAVLSNPFIATPVSLNLNDIRAASAGLNITFSEWLVRNGSKTLATSAKIPTLQTKFAEYKDAFKAGYHVQPVSPTASPDAELPVADKFYLHLTKPGTDMAYMAKSCLVSVNGFFHYMEGSKDGAWVFDGMRSRTVSRQNQIGLVNFQRLGSLRYKAITPAMLYKQTEGQLYRDRVCLDVGESLDNKTVFLVLGGYLHVCAKELFYRIGDSLMEISTGNIPLIERFHESSKYLDLSSLPFFRTPQNNSQLAVEEFLSDENLAAYLTLSQSFLVILDNPDVYVEREYVKVTGIPGMLIGYTEPKYPLVNGVGKVSEYWSVYEDRQWAINCFDNVRHNRLYDTVNIRKQLAVADSRQTQELTVNSLAYFLKIGTDI